MTHRLRAPSPALVVSLIALFVALGGTTYAATTLPANSVGTRQLRDGAVTKKKIGKKTLQALRGNRGPQGPTGTAGAQGVKGDTGAPGRDGAAVAVRIRSSAGVPTPSNGSSASVPLTSNTWTQAATEVELGFGMLTYTAPSSSTCGGTGLADLNVQISIDGTLFIASTIQSARDGATRTAVLTASHALFEPGSATTRTATASVSSVCESGSFPVSFTVSALRLDMIRAS